MSSVAKSSWFDKTRAITITFNLILILNFITKVHSLATIIIVELARAGQLLVWFPDPVPREINALRVYFTRV